MYVAFARKVERFAAVFVERLARFVLDARDGLALAVAVVVEFVGVAVDPDIAVCALLLDGHVGAVAEPAQGHEICGRLIRPAPEYMELVRIRTGDLHVVEFSFRIHVETLHHGVALELYTLAVNDLFGQSGRHFFEDGVVGYRDRCPGVYAVGGCYRHRRVAGSDSGDDALGVDMDRVFIARVPDYAQRVRRLVVPVGLGNPSSRGDDLDAELLRAVDADADRRFLEENAQHVVLLSVVGTGGKCGGRRQEEQARQQGPDSRFAVCLFCVHGRLLISLLLLFRPATCASRSWRS